MNRLHSRNLSNPAFAVMAASLLGLLFVTAAPACAADDEKSGTIQRASEAELVLRVGTESVTYKVNGQTTVTLNGKAAKIEDLKTGDAAKVKFTSSDDGDMTASSIAVTREEDPENP